MALFILYSDLSDNHDEWEITLKEIAQWKHDICFITNRNRHQLPPLSDKAHLLEHKPDETFDIQLKKIKEITKFTNGPVIVGVPKDKGPIVEAGVPEKQVIILQPQQKSYLEKEQHDKSHFNKLIRAADFFKHSNSPEFEEIHTVLAHVRYELNGAAPTTPKLNLKAQLRFLEIVLIIAEQNQHLSKEECLIHVKQDYIQRNILTDVISAPINYPGFRWDAIKAILNFPTETGNLLVRAQNTIDEKNAKKEVEDRNKITPPAANLPKLELENYQSTIGMKR